MPTKHLQIIEHPKDVVRVRPPDVHVSRRDEVTTLDFDNHLGEEVTVVLNPDVNPDPGKLNIAPGGSESSDIKPQQGGTFPYQIHIGRGTDGPKAKGLCDPIIIVRPPGWR